MELAFAEIRFRKDYGLYLEVEANALNRTPLCTFETGWKLRVQVVGFINRDFQKRIGNTKCGAATHWVVVVTPRLFDGIRLDSRAYRTRPWIGYFYAPGH